MCKQKRRPGGGFNWLVAAGLFGAAVAALAAGSLAGRTIPPVNLTPSKSVNERLFLVQAVAHMYEVCLGAAKDPREFKADVEKFRPVALGLLRHIYEKGMGKPLATLYRGYLRNMDSFENYQEQVAASSSEASSERSRAGTKGAIQGFLSGLSAGGAAEAHPVVALGTVLYGLYRAYKFEAGADQRISDQERAAINAARRDLRDQIEPSLMHGQAISDRLAAKYRWPPGITGFDMGQGEGPQPPGAKQDPFDQLAEAANVLKWARASLRTPNPISLGRVLADAVWESDHCLRAARMVPPGRAYRIFRQMAIEESFFAAAIARGAEQRLGIDPGGSTAISRLRVALARLVLSYSPRDPLVEELYFTSLMEDNAKNAAVTASSKLTPDAVLGDDPGFCYNYACLCSRLGEFKIARGWLRSALSNGFDQPWLAVEDPDLAAIRAAEPRRFKKIVCPSTSYSVNPGDFFGDDAVLANNSVYPITNVSLTIKLADGTTLVPLTCNRIPPGMSHTWTNCAHAGQLANSSLSAWDCDESEMVREAIDHRSLALQADLKHGRIVQTSAGDYNPAPGYDWADARSQSNCYVLSADDCSTVGDTLEDLSNALLPGDGFAEAVKWYRKAAAAGSGSAMHNIGWLYDCGQGVPQDYAKAMEWYRRAAAAGNADAMSRIGLLYTNGQGVPQDYAKALEWYRRGAAAGSGLAMFNIGVLFVNGQGVQQDYAKAEAWWHKAAAAGSGLAMNYIGVLYANGQGVPQDYAKAMEWGRKAAAAGNVDAMNNIGLLYDHGEGVPQDYAKAMEWYRRAAAAGSGFAMLGIGELYYFGHGVLRNYAKALHWLHKAAASGDRRAVAFAKKAIAKIRQAQAAQNGGQ